MNLNGRRQSENVDDRRSGGMSTAKKAGGIGIGSLIVIALFTYFTSNGDMGQVLNAVIQNSSNVQITSSDPNYTPSAEEDSLAVFASQIMASTEDIWTAEFKKMGKAYKAPKLVLYTGTIQTGCGNGTASMGPFYCSADQCVYLDLSFLSEMKSQLGAKGGDFANAYVIGHEVGHHVQYLLGTLDKEHAIMSRQSESESNKTSVRIELQADFYAGVWGHQENATFNSLDNNDMMEAIDLAQKIGDDYLQRKAGYSTTVPDAFTHGTAEQRQRWLKKGLSTGDMSQGDTYSVNYNDL